MNITDQEVTEPTSFEQWKQKYLEGNVYEWLNIIASKSQHYSLCDKIMQAFVGPQQKVDWSHRLFPIEIRFVQSDEIWLSPAYHRDSVYFAVHTYRGEDHRFYFEGLQQIFKHYQGRPHWGKWHSLTAKELYDLYPKFNEFAALRAKLDPHSIFINDYLKEILAS